MLCVPLCFLSKLPSEVLDNRLNQFLTGSRVLDHIAGVKWSVLGQWGLMWQGRVGVVSWRRWAPRWEEWTEELKSKLLHGLDLTTPAAPAGFGNIATSWGRSFPIPWDGAGSTCGLPQGPVSTWIPLLVPICSEKYNEKSWSRHFWERARGKE